MVFSAHVGSNDDVFPQVLSLYVAPGSTVADVTHGKGVFWRNVPAGMFRLLPSDAATGTDCRDLPYGDSAIDCVVFDPPYMHTPGGTTRRFAATWNGLVRAHLLIGQYSCRTVQRRHRMFDAGQAIAQTAY